MSWPRSSIGVAALSSAVLGVGAGAAWGAPVASAGQAALSQGAADATAVSADAGPASAAASTLRAVDRPTGVTAASGNQDVTAPQRAGQGVRIAGSNAGDDLTITPELHGSRPAMTTGVTTVLADSTNGLNVAVQPLPHAARMMSVLASPAAPTATAYRVSLPAGERLQKDSLGGVMVVKRGVIVGRFDAPWAIDASNRSLPTTYTVTASTITQTVNTAGAKFPVVADPHYTWGWVTGTVYFNKSETEKIAASATFVAALGAFAPPPFDFILVASAGSIALGAAWALADGQCVQVKSDGNITEYGGDSGDGYCR